jgi:hypothetical protein
MIELPTTWYVNIVDGISRIHVRTFKVESTRLELAIQKAKLQARELGLREPAVLSAGGWFDRD